MGGAARFRRARRRLDEEARLEIEAHLEMLTERYVRAGLPAEEARVAARRQFGNVTLAREEIHGMNSIRWIEPAIGRICAGDAAGPRAPGYAAVVIATLALGIGGTTAVFSVVQAVLLAPLPYEAPGQLVRFYQHDPASPRRQTAHRRAFQRFVPRRRRRSRTWRRSHLLGDRARPRLGGGAQRLRVLPVTGEYFTTLAPRRCSAAASSAATKPGRAASCLSDASGARASARSRHRRHVIRLTPSNYEVAGVARQGFSDPVAETSMPGCRTACQRYLRGELLVVGDRPPPRRRRRREAQAELASLSPSFRARWPDAKQSDIAAVPLQEDLVTPSRSAAAAPRRGWPRAARRVPQRRQSRARSRDRPRSRVRGALSARSGRARLVRQLFVESLVLPASAAGSGCALAVVGVDVLRSRPRRLPRLDEIGLDPAVLLFAAVTTIATAVVFGVAPALRLAGARRRTRCGSSHGPPPAPDGRGGSAARSPRRRLHWR